MKTLFSIALVIIGISFPSLAHSQACGTSGKYPSTVAADQGSCGNVAPYPAAPSSPTSITGCASLSASTKYKLTADIGSSQTANCLSIPGPSTTVDLNGHTITGYITGTDPNGVHIYSSAAGGTVNCTADSSPQVSCLYWNVSTANLTAVFELDHITITNNAVSTNSARNFFMDYNTVSTGSLIGSITTKVHHITSTSATGTSSNRIVNLQTQGLDQFTEFYNNNITCKSSAGACQGIVAYGGWHYLIHNNLGTNQLANAADTDTARAYICDTAPGGCEIYNNFVTTNDSRCIRYRTTSNGHGANSFHDNICDAIVGGTNPNYIAAAHIADPTPDILEAEAFTGYHNIFNISSGTVMMARDGTGILWQDNTINASGGCSGCLLMYDRLGGAGGTQVQFLRSTISGTWTNSPQSIGDAGVATSPVNLCNSGTGNANLSVNNSVCATSTVPTRFSILTTSTSTIPTPAPLDIRGCCGQTPDQLNTAAGTYDFSSLDPWVNYAKAHGATFLYTFTYTPTWASTDGTLAGPYNDLASAVTCPAPVAALGSQKGCYITALLSQFMQHYCHVTYQPTTPLYGMCDVKYIEPRNESNVGRYFTGTATQFAQMTDYMAKMVHAYCGDCYFVVGSNSAGGGGTNGQYNTWFTSELNAWAGISGHDVADMASYHPYPARTTVIPVPFPTSLISHGFVTCSSSSAILAASITSGHAGSGYSAGDLFSISGGTGGQGKVLTLSGSAVATFSITIQGTGYSATTAHSTTAVTGGGSGLQVNITSVGASTDSSCVCASYNTPNVSCNTAVMNQTSVLRTLMCTGAAAGVTCPGGTAVPIITTEGGQGETHSLTDGVSGTSTNTWTLRKAWLAQWMLTQQMGNVQIAMYYNLQDQCWMPMLATSSTCAGDPAILPLGNTPIQPVFVQVQTWLANTTGMPSTPTATPVSGGNIWTANVTFGGVSAQYAWFDGWLTTTSYTPPVGTVTSQNINGTVTPVSGPITLSQSPVLLQQSTAPAMSVGMCGGVAIVGGTGKAGVQ